MLIAVLNWELQLTTTFLGLRMQFEVLAKGEEL